MKIYALVGPSGTGKSYNALRHARDLNIKYIIDDGLLISENKIIAGVSAKKENTKIAAVKRAIFLDKFHCERVSAAIKEHNPESILILGTSDNMIEKIVRILNLRPIFHTTYIQDIVSEKDIEKAQYIRKNEGKHIIPLPTFEVKKQFSGYFINPFSVFSKVRHSNSIIRPTFSYRGSYTISDKAISDICEAALIKLKSSISLKSVSVSSYENGIVINLKLGVKYGIKMPVICKRVQNRVFYSVSKYTAINVLKVNILIKELF